jgi:hypothetical protein
LEEGVASPFDTILSLPLYIIVLPLSVISLLLLLPVFASVFREDCKLDNVRDGMIRSLLLHGN